MAQDKEPPDDPEEFTNDDLDERLDALVIRARKAGLNPFRRIARRGAREFLDLVEGAMSALEGDEDDEDDPPRKKRKR